MRLPSRISYLAVVAAGLLAAAACFAHDDAAPDGLGFSDLPGWANDDHSAALLAFRRSCMVTSRRFGPCRAAARAVGRGQAAARHVFETWFEPVEIAPRGFLTGYYEPELAASLDPDPRYRTPLLARPSGLVDRPPGPAPEGWPEGLTVARRNAAGFSSLPDRGAIEEGALGPDARVVAYLADPVDAFSVHVQGSARLRLADGRAIRVGFDGRNGYPYTSIGRVLAEREGVPPAEMTADRLFAWLKDHPADAPRIMRANRSYIFFRRLPDRADDRPQVDGPLGGAGVPLTAGRSLAVDRRAWPYGTLIWLEGELPRPSGGNESLRRLMVAQDTGAAIVGTARGDLFFGSGEAAGAAASLVRHPVRWVVLRQRRRPGSVGRP